ncbi:Hypothetical predicted protein [Octopus vulgaris]|uniref:Pcf11 C-terminal domain-containing protein n=1 Tax=Octopus vulgaris TaxID=6645 RepID=A0AA36B3J9_OCTVU|nr:Hypothetical predicted protein [Octopus vulgaris]
MNRNNSRYVWKGEGKENQPEYQVSNTGTYFNNYHRYRNNRWQPYCLQRHRSLSGFGNGSRRYLQHRNLQQSHYAQYTRSRYQRQNEKQPWLLSQSTTTNSNSMLQSPIVSMDSYHTIPPVVQQNKVLQAPDGSTHEFNGNHVQDGQRLSTLNKQYGQPDASGTLEMKTDVNNVQNNQEYKSEEKERKSENNRVKWKDYKAKYGNELKIKSTIRFKSLVDKIKDNTCNLKVHYVEDFFKNRQNGEICDVKAFHKEPMKDYNESKMKVNTNQTKWKLYKLEHGNELKVKSSLTPMYPSVSQQKMRNILPNFDTTNFTTVSQSLVHQLYSGKQCSICGDRRSSIDNDHMDAHFRENSFAKHRNYSKHRHWYLQEDYAEENPFELQLRKHQHNKKKNITGPTKHSGNDVCLVCKEKFTEFFNHEDGEWQLNDAIDIDGNTYHEICAEDRHND